MHLRAMIPLGFLVALASCSTTSRQPPAPAPFTFTGKGEEVAVGEKMVNHRSVSVTEDRFVGRSLPNGTREAFTYLGLAPGDAREKTIRVRYESWRIVDGVESPTVTERAEIRLDLSLGDVIVHRTWRIGVVEASARSIRFVAVEVPQ